MIYQMFTLVTDRSKYFRVKRGQVSEEIEKALGTPVIGAAFAGAIIPISDVKLTLYTAGVGDTYRSISLKTGADEATLKKINGGKHIYPTCKLFVPCK